MLVLFVSYSPFVLLDTIIHDSEAFVKPPKKKSIKKYRKILSPLSTVVIYTPTDPLSTLANTAEKRGGAVLWILI